MQKIFLLLLVLHFSTIMQAQPSQTITPIRATAHKLFEFHQQDITFNQSAYRLFIAVPKIDYSAHIFPVLYMLDGNGQFPMLINAFDSVSNNTPIIVGLGYSTEKAYPQARTQDYTIPVKSENTGGGAENFYTFIQEKVKPFVESTFQIDNNKQTLCGHSFGGLFTLYVLFNHTDAFNHYVAASPSIWWGNGAVIPEQRPFFSTLPESVTITLGAYEEDPEADPARKNLSPELLAQKDARVSNISARTLASWIAQEVPACNFISYEGKNHGSSIPSFLKEVIEITHR